MRKLTQWKVFLLIGGINVGLIFPTSIVKAELTDATQTFPHVPGSAIAKSLEEQVGEGQGNEVTPGSSIYLIKRDPARSIRRGRQLFQRKFTADQGIGPPGEHGRFRYRLFIPVVYKGYPPHLHQNRSFLHR